MKKLFLTLLVSIPLIGFGQEEKETNFIALEDVVIIKSKAYFKKDSTLVTGQVKGFHPDGKPYIDVTITNGNPNGVHKRWDENGVLTEEYLYKDGIEIEN